MSSLSPIQQRILHLLTNPDSEAETSLEIAAELHLTKRSVDHHMERIYEFYGVRSSRGLIRVLSSNEKEMAT